MAKSAFGSKFPKDFHYEGNCSSSMEVTLTKIFNEDKSFQEPWTSLHDFYPYFLNTPGIMERFSRVSTYQPIALIRLTGDYLKRANSGKARVYLMHPKNSNNVSQCYLYVEELRHRNSMAKMLKRPILEPLMLMLMSEYDVEKRDVEAKWFSASIDDGEKKKKYVVKRLRQKNEIPDPEDCFAYKSNGVCYWW